MFERSLGLSKNTASALSYVLFFVSGLFFLIAYKDQSVRFHAMQSTLLFASLFVLQWLLGASIVLASLVPLVGLLIFILWLILIYKAWQGEDWEVPLVGHYARSFVKNGR